MSSIPLFTAQTDHTSAFLTLCDTYRTQFNSDCETFIDHLKSPPTSLVTFLLSAVTYGDICLMELEGQEEQTTDACEIFEKVCTQVVTCSAHGKDYFKSHGSDK